MQLSLARNSGLSRRDRPTSIAALFGLLAFVGAVQVFAPAAAVAMDDEGPNACEAKLPGYIVNEETGVCELDEGGEEVIVIHDPVTPEVEVEVEVCEPEPQVCLPGDDPVSAPPAGERGDDGSRSGGRPGSDTAPWVLKLELRREQLRKCLKIQNDANAIFDRPVVNGQGLAGLFGEKIFPRGGGVSIRQGVPIFSFPDPESAFQKKRLRRLWKDGDCLKHLGRQLDV